MIMMMMMKSGMLIHLMVMTLMMTMWLVYDGIASFVVVIDDENYTSYVVVIVDVNVMMLFHGLNINNRWNLHKFRIGGKWI